MRIRDDLGLTVAWINGHHAHSCAQLAAINPADAKFATEMGRNLIICFAGSDVSTCMVRLRVRPAAPVVRPALQDKRRDGEGNEGGSDSRGTKVLQQQAVRGSCPLHHAATTEDPDTDSADAEDPDHSAAGGRTEETEGNGFPRTSPQLRARGAQFRGERRRGTCAPQLPQLLRTRKQSKLQSFVRKESGGRSRSTKRRRRSASRRKQRKQPRKLVRHRRRRSRRRRNRARARRSRRRHCVARRGARQRRSDGA